MVLAAHVTHARHVCADGTQGKSDALLSSVRETPRIDWSLGPS